MNCRAQLRNVIKRVFLLSFRFLARFEAALKCLKIWIWFFVSSFNYFVFLEEDGLYIMKHDFSYITITSHERVTRPSPLHDELSREYYEQSRKHEEQSQEHNEYLREYYLRQQCRTKTFFVSQLICTLNVWHKKWGILSIKVEQVLKKWNAQLAPKNTLLTQPTRCRSSAL